MSKSKKSDGKKPEVTKLSKEDLKKISGGSYGKVAGAQTVINVASISKSGSLVKKK